MKDFTIKVLPEQSNLSYAMEFIEDTLVKCQISGKDKSKSVLLAEEYLVELFKVTKDNRDVIIRVRRFLGKTTITLMAESTQKSRKNLWIHFGILTIMNSLPMQRLPSEV